ncbi:MAG: NUDIX domain-containing protein [Spirochaetales bacterium]|nr:NUDIX domain-containing protein [Spirochaetales bacterium]
MDNIYVLCIIVDNHGRYLLIKEAKEECKNTWFFPAGRIEKNESIINAAIRETKEESGIDIRPEGICLIDHIPKDNWMRFTLLARPTGGKLKTFSDHHSLEAGWFTADEVANLGI